MAKITIMEWTRKNDVPLAWIGQGIRTGALTLYGRGPLATADESVLDAWLANNPVPRTISLATFMQRFTQAERAAILANSQAHLWWMELVTLGDGTVNLADPVIVADVNSLTTAGVLAAGRAAEILAA